MKPDEFDDQVKRDVDEAVRRLSEWMDRELAWLPRSPEAWTMHTFGLIPRSHFLRPLGPSGAAAEYLIRFFDRSVWPRPFAFVTREDWDVDVDPCAPSVLLEVES